jgi:hypothetical protein
MESEIRKMIVGARRQIVTDFTYANLGKTY